MTKFALPALALAALLPATLVPAAIVYDSGLSATSGGGGGVTADTANTAGIPSVDFSLPADANVNQVQWAGKYYTGNVPPAVDNFTIRFYALGPAPSSVPTAPPLFTYNVGNAVNRTSTGNIDGNGQTVYTYDALIPNTALPAGRYAFSVQDATTPAHSDNVFFWRTAFFPGHQQFLDNFLLNDNFNSTFTLLNTIPEPAALTALTLASLLLRRRRRA